MNGYWIMMKFNQDFKEREERNLKKNQSEINRLKRQVRDKEQEIRKLITYYKHDPASLNKKYIVDDKKK